MKRRLSNQSKPDDSWLKLKDAAAVLRDELGPGWGMTNIKRQIAGDRSSSFCWIEHIHYRLTQNGAVFKINVDAVLRELQVVAS